MNVVIGEVAVIGTRSSLSCQAHRRRRRDEASLPVDYYYTYIFNADHDKQRSRRPKVHTVRSTLLLTTEYLVLERLLFSFKFESHREEQDMMRDAALTVCRCSLASSIGLPVGERSDVRLVPVVCLWGTFRYSFGLRCSSRNQK